MKLQEWLLVMMVVVTMVVNQGEIIRIVISYDGCGYNSCKSGWNYKNGY